MYNAITKESYSEYKEIHLATVVQNFIVTHLGILSMQWLIAMQKENASLNAVVYLKLRSLSQFLSKNTPWMIPIDIQSHKGDSEAIMNIPSHLVVYKHQHLLCDIKLCNGNHFIVVSFWYGKKYAMMECKEKELPLSSLIT